MHTKRARMWFSAAFLVLALTLRLQSVTANYNSQLDSKVVFNPYVYKYLTGYYNGANLKNLGTGSRRVVHTPPPQQQPSPQRRQQLQQHKQQQQARPRGLLPLVHGPVARNGFPVRRGPIAMRRPSMRRIPVQRRRKIPFQRFMQQAAKPVQRQKVRGAPVNPSASAQRFAGRAAPADPRRRPVAVRSPFAYRPSNPNTVQFKYRRPVLPPLRIQKSPRPVVRHPVRRQPPPNQQQVQSPRRVAFQPSQLLQQGANVAKMLPIFYHQGKAQNYGLTNIPLYGSNPYKVFGPMTYGPLPKPSNYGTMRMAYNPTSYQAPAGHAPHPFSTGGYTAYQPQQQQQQQVHRPVGYGTGGCGYMPPGMCAGRYAGHYTHPGSRHCFIQCDHVGRAYAKPCAGGTVWKQLGPEPALYNYCS